MLGTCESRNVDERFIINVGSPVSGRSGVLNNIATLFAIDRVCEVNIIGKDGGAINEFESSMDRPNCCSCGSTGGSSQGSSSQRSRMRGYCKIDIPMNTNSKDASLGPS